MLALLYLGGACAQASGVTFPPTGTGNKVYADFKGKGKEPPRLTVSYRRHMPLVKPVVVPPAVAVLQPQIDQHEECAIVPETRFCLTPHASLSFCRNDRAPPRI